MRTSTFFNISNPDQIKYQKTTNFPVTMVSSFCLIKQFSGLSLCIYIYGRRRDLLRKKNKKNPQTYRI